MRLHDNSVPTVFLTPNYKLCQESPVLCETSNMKKSVVFCTSTVMPLLQSPHRIVETVHKEKMKIVIFGSTGMTGLCAVAAALKKGYSVRAFVRDPKKIPDEYKNKVEVFQGNVLEPDSVADAIDGMNGVVIALGTGHDMPSSLAPTSDMSEGTKNILEAMRAKNVKPVSVCLSAFLLYEPEKVPKIFVDLTKDHKRMWDTVRESPLDWIAVFPPRIEDTPSREYTVVENCTKSPGPIISKWDLGAFLVESLTEPKYYKKDIGICNK